jgi:serine/threonine protein phosphatase 1
MADMKPNRVNVDTGAVFGGPLTAAVFIESQQGPISILQVPED